LADRPRQGFLRYRRIYQTRVIVPNISNDPRWPDDARDLTLRHGFIAAWSEPLISKDGEVLARSQWYYPEPRTPQSSDFELIAAAGHIARIAIEVEQSHLALKNALIELRTLKIDSEPSSIRYPRWPGLPSDGSAEFFNRRWLDYCGLSSEEASVGDGRPQYTPPIGTGSPTAGDRFWHRASQERSKRASAASTGVHRWFLFRASPLRDESGDIVKWYGINADIEKRKRAEEALRSKEQSLRLIVDTMPGMVCTLSAAGEVQLLNRQVLEYFGKTSEELKNWSTSDAVHPDDLPRVIDMWRRSVEAGQPYEYELRQRRADGMYRWFQSRALPVRDTEDRISGWYMLLTDVDDRKRNEVQLARAHDEIAKSEPELRTSSMQYLSSSSRLGPTETFCTRIRQYWNTRA